MLRQKREISQTIAKNLSRFTVTLPALLTFMLAFTAISYAQSWETFSKPDKDTLSKSLTPMQFKVTQRDGTEPPFDNAYWNNTRAGLYVDIVSGEPLFSSRDKYKSGTGWPSFTRPLSPDAITQRTDWKMIIPRTEVRSRLADSHLGHVFDDGPAPTGLRYCMNSAALRFIPLENMAAEGYSDFIDQVVATDKDK